jgi:hypothetical protein
VLDATLDSLRRLRGFARSMNPDLPAVDVALPEVRRLFAAAQVPFKLVGGVAVVHHGYARTTEDVDILVDSGVASQLDPLLAAHSFERVSSARLRHTPTTVRVDLLVAGEPMPGREPHRYPSPSDVGASARDPMVIDLQGLVSLKLRARRHRDLADVVELLKRLDEAHYLELEAATDRALRQELSDLRRDALEEIAFER